MMIIKHNIQTNEFGVFSTVVGFGESTFLGSVSDFELIDWSEGSVFIKIDIDFDNDGPEPPISFGESQLFSVPYALFATSSGDQYWHIENGVIEPDNEMLSINLNSADVDISSDNINIGNTNTMINFHFSQMDFWKDNELFIAFNDISELIED